MNDVSRRRQDRLGNNDGILQNRVSPDGNSLKARPQKILFADISGGSLAQKQL
jgi:hypothetical protein